MRQTSKVELPGGSLGLERWGGGNPQTKSFPTNKEYGH